VLAAVRIQTAVLYCPKVGAVGATPAELIVTPEPAANVNNPAPVLTTVIAEPTAALVNVESGAIVTVLVDALLVATKA
jgi:hypothetical protein